MRAILYARYSSENQRDASIEDQFRICRAYAHRQGWTIALECSDAAVSGASLFRPGIQTALEAARAGRANILMAESLDRFSRDQEDTAGIFKRLDYARVQLVTVSEGVIGHLHVGLKGTMNALYLKDLAEKTHRGMRGLAESGRPTGGRTFGYRVQDGQRIINELEAAIVRRIFGDYVAGISPKSIARALNAESIRPPRGRAWGPSTVSGHAKRGTGILNNELYIGRAVWNRQQFRKHPDTGKRIARLRLDELVVSERPDLRIVDDSIWQAAKARQAVTRELMAGALWHGRRHEYFLSGLVHCAECGYGFVSYSSERLKCTGARERGVCSNRRTIRRADVERRVLDAIERRTMRSELFEVFCQEVRRLADRLTQEQRTRAAEASRERSVLDRDIARLIDFIKGGEAGPSVRAELRALEQRKAGLADVAVPRLRALRLPADLAGECRAEFGRLRDACEARTIDARAREALRGMVRDVRLKPAAEGLAIEVTGTYAGLLGPMWGIDGCGGPLPSIPLADWTVAA